MHVCGRACRRWAFTPCAGWVEPRRYANNWPKGHRRLRPMPCCAWFSPCFGEKKKHPRLPLRLRLRLLRCPPRGLILLGAARRKIGRQPIQTSRWSTRLLKRPSAAKRPPTKPASSMVVCGVFYGSVMRWWPRPMPTRKPCGTIPSGG